MVDDLSTPLADVTFVVLDLETTGGSPHDCAITEVGALKLRGGELLGTFETLVNPGVALPPDIVYLTGITEAMVAPAPPIESVLPALAEFIGDAVVVGHNVRFDLGFLRANLARLGYPPLTNRSVDTCLLARRLVGDELRDHKLGTVARHYRTPTDPCHRAMADARATAEALHRMLEDVGGAAFGITCLDDLLELPRTAGHPQVAKLGWVGRLPRSPGVYVFRDVGGRVLYVGRATDLHRRVRAYFAGFDRRRTRPLLREAHSLEHVVCASDLEAAVLELRLVVAHAPRYNRDATAWRRYRYVDSSAGKVVRTVRPGAARPGRYVGPFRSTAVARSAASAPATLARAASRQRRLEALVAAGRIEVEVDVDGTTAPVVVDAGRLVSPVADAPAPRPAQLADGGPLAFDAVDEVAFLSSWLEARARAGRLRLVSAEHGWAEPLRVVA